MKQTKNNLTTNVKKQGGPTRQSRTILYLTDAQDSHGQFKLLFLQFSDKTSSCRVGSGRGRVRFIVVSRFIQILFLHSFLQYCIFHYFTINLIFIIVAVLYLYIFYLKPNFCYEQLPLGWGRSGLWENPPVAPRKPQVVPKTPQEAIRSPQEAPWGPQESLKLKK